VARLCYLLGDVLAVWRAIGNAGKQPGFVERGDSWQALKGEDRLHLNPALEEYIEG
jgi:hypothetical protein